MSWSNYASLIKPLEIPEVQVTGSGAHTRIAPAAPKTIPHRAETKAGGADVAPPAEATAFVKAQTQRVRVVSVDPAIRTRPWFNNAMTTSNNDYSAFVGKLAAQLQRGVNEQSLTEAQAVLNEISRTPEGAAAVQKQFTSDVIAQLIKTSKGQA